MNRKSQKIKIGERQTRGFLTEREVELLMKQVRYNSVLIDHYIKAIDMLVNKEICPKDANTLIFLRNRLSVAIAESDTFRKVLWKHKQMKASEVCEGDIAAMAFLINRIQTRKKAFIAQMARKSNGR